MSVIGELRRILEQWESCMLVNKEWASASRCKLRGKIPWTRLLIFRGHMHEDTRREAEGENRIHVKNVTLIGSLQLTKWFWETIGWRKGGTRILLSLKRGFCKKINGIVVSREELGKHASKTSLSL
jgi:hypothetical protein